MDVKEFNKLTADEKFVYDIHQIRLALGEMNMSLQGIQQSIRKFAEVQS